MPIRKRLTDLHGQDYKEFQKRRKEGAPPKAPRKPTAEERKPLLAAFARVPIGKAMANSEWTGNYQLMFLRQVYPLWGMELALYASASQRDTHGNVSCNGLFVMQLTKTRRGIQPKLLLKGDPTRWYGKVIDWIGENNYGL